MGGGSSKVVEEWHSDDGSSWYRKWSSGLIEQGGTTPNLGADARVNVTFVVPFTRFQISGSIQRCNGTGDWVPSFINMSLTSVTIVNNGSQGNPKLFWYLAGY